MAPVGLDQEFSSFLDIRTVKLDQNASLSRHVFIHIKIVCFDYLINGFSHIVVPH